MYKVKNQEATLTPEGIYPMLKKEEFFSSKVRLENTLIFLTILNFHALNVVKKKKTNKLCPLSSELIIAILGRDYYSKIIDKLVEMKIIQMSRNFIINQRPYLYKLHDSFNGLKSYARVLKESKSIKKFKNIENYFLKKIDNEFGKTVYENLGKIHIDKESANIRCFELELDEDQLFSYLNRINAIFYGYDNEFSISKSNGRLFASVVNLPRELRPFLYVVNEKTGELIFNKIEIDGANTQPCLVCIRMKQLGIEPERDFYCACFDGDIYDMIAYEIDERLFSEDGEELNQKGRRKWVKNRFMDTLLFTRSNGDFSLNYNNVNYLNEQKQIFTKYFIDRFPIVFNWLKKTKQERTVKLKEIILKEKKDGIVNKRNTYNLGGSDLALEIQRMESDLWINGLLKAVVNEYKLDFVYFTIHDSIVIFNDNPEIIKFIKDKFRELSIEMYGVSLPLNEKRTGESPLDEDIFLLA